jgi:hypothetical protein
MRWGSGRMTSAPICAWMSANGAELVAKLCVTRLWTFPFRMASRRTNLEIVILSILCFSPSFLREERVVSHLIKFWYSPTQNHMCLNTNQLRLSPAKRDVHMLARFVTYFHMPRTTSFRAAHILVWRSTVRLCC